MNLFWKQGYAATSVQDLVSHLGINRASLYDTYGDKEQLFKKAFELYRKETKEGLIEFLKNQPNIKDGVSALFDAAIDEAIVDKDRKGCFVVNTTTALIPSDNHLLNVLEVHKSDIETLFYEYLKRGRDSDQIKANSDLKSLTSLLYTLYNGIRVVSKVNPEKQQLSRSIRLALSLLE